MTTIEKFDIDNPDHMLRALREYIEQSYAAPRFPRSSYVDLDDAHGGWIEFAIPGTDVKRELVWDQEYWIAEVVASTIPFSPECGTACCAGGFANLVVNVHGTPVDEDGGWHDALRRYGLIADQDVFFAASNTANEMIAMIDALLAEGETKYEVDLDSVRDAVRDSVRS